MTANLVIPVCVVTSSNPSTSITQEEVMEVMADLCLVQTKTHCLTFLMSNCLQRLKNRPLWPFCARKDFCFQNVMLHILIT